MAVPGDADPALGVVVPDLIPEPPQWQPLSLRPGAADEAARVAAILGAEPRDFSAYHPAPPPGTLEVWRASGSPVEDPTGG